MVDIAEFLERVEQRLSRIEDKLDRDSQPNLQKEMYTVVEAAELLGKKPFTIREWCRHGRIHAEKADCGRGHTKEWRISHDALTRYRNHGLLQIDSYTHVK